MQAIAGARTGRQALWAGFALASAAATAAGAAAWHARHLAPYRPVLERVAVQAPAGCAGLRGLRIGFVTDTHIGPVIRPADVERALTLLSSASPDLLLLGGDYVCESPRHIPDAAALLKDFAAEARYGALAVLGNHDYSNDASRLTALFERRGIRVLRNTSVRIATGGDGLWVAGIDDAILGRPDLGRTFADIPAGEQALALWHEPDWAERTARHPAFLQLSGHSHGGQVRLPFLGNVAAPTGGRRFVSGLSAVAGMPVYTSRGVGIFRPPVRVRCSPEVTLLSLV